jgi:hypothetical protein
MLVVIVKIKGQAIRLDLPNQKGEIKMLVIIPITLMIISIIGLYNTAKQIKRIIKGIKS